MRRKMRWRFIGVAMTAFTAVILVLLVVINLWNYASQTAQQDQTLQALVQQSLEGRPLGRPGDRFSPEFQHMIRYFSVFYDADGALLIVNQDFITSIDREDALFYAQKVLKCGKDSGYLGMYRYCVTDFSSGTAVFFLYAEREIHAMQSLLLITALVALGSLIAVFLLMLALSGKAIAPYIRNLEAQKEFITNASHELKTPLTAISTSADVLSLEVSDNEWVENIQFQAGKMSKLIGDLVMLCRLDEANPFPERADFSLSDAVWEISEPFAALAQAKEKEFTQQIADNLVFHGNRASIQQMVSILLDNAVKYSEENGKIRLKVAKAGRKIEITVYNTCPPRKSHDLSRLFDRFYRGDSARNSRDSFGIGLSIAKSVAENHGGTIKATSQTDCDLTITVRL